MNSIQTYLGSHGILDENPCFRERPPEFKEKDIASSWDPTLSFDSDLNDPVTQGLTQGGKLLPALWFWPIVPGNQTGL